MAEAAKEAPKAEAPKAAPRAHAKKADEGDAVHPPDTGPIDALEGLSRRELARLKSFVDRALGNNGEDSDVRGEGAVPDTVRLTAGVLPVNRAATAEVTPADAAKAADVKEGDVLGFNVRQAQPEENLSTVGNDTGYGQKYIVVTTGDGEKHISEL